MIVDDAFMIRVLLRNLLEQDDQHRFKVVASAVNGEDAVAKALKENIDVILMDIEMPRKTGLEALKEIMEVKPTPVIMFSSLTKKGAKETIQALSMGAVDFITKDRDIKKNEKQLKEELFEKIIEAKNINRKNIRYTRYVATQEPATQEPNKPVKGKEGQSLTNLIAIGCSTGGPTALQKILSQLPKDLKAGILIVQHMPEGGYIASLANYLNQVSAFNVKEAVEGDEIVDGAVYIAPGGRHLEVIKRGGKYQCSLNKRQESIGHRPSVDMLYYSLAKIANSVPQTAIILTGMGNDGTNGVTELKKGNVTVITESEKTAVIYGMPKQVEKRGLSDYVKDLDDIVPLLIDLL